MDECTCKNCSRVNCKMRYEPSRICCSLWHPKSNSAWIPCSERLPVLYVPVIILTDDGSYAIAHVTGNENEYLWFGDGGHYSKDYVLFWMPLPEPPKE